MGARSIPNAKGEFEYFDPADVYRRCNFENEVSDDLVKTLDALADNPHFEVRVPTCDFSDAQLIPAMTGITEEMLRRWVKQGKLIYCGIYDNKYGQEKDRRCKNAEMNTAVLYSIKKDDFDHKKCDCFYYAIPQDGTYSDCSAEHFLQFGDFAICFCWYICV